MEKLLSEASLEGNVSSLLGLLREDPSILDRCTILNPYDETPLHVATMRGHLDFVREILKQKPELATELNSRRSSPLHLASGKGYVEIVKELLLVSPDMCLASDRDGLNPVHLAAMKGRTDVLKELLQVRVHAARAMAHRSETVLHLCVKHNQVEALKLLVETLRDREFVNSKDDDGHTILDIALTDKQIETVKFLLQNTSMEVNETNRDGVTAMGILAQSQRDVNDKEIKKRLLSEGAMEANRNNSVQNHTETSLTILEPAPASEKNIETLEIWLKDNRNTIMVVSSLIATMAFQVGVNPPGGVWQEYENSTNSSMTPRHFKHIPGTSIMAEVFSVLHVLLLIFNTFSFLSSLTIIVLLISGLPFKRPLLMYMLRGIMCVAATTTTVTYLICVVTLADNKVVAWITFGVLMVGWVVLLAVIILFHGIRLTIQRWYKWINFHS